LEDVTDDSVAAADVTVGPQRMASVDERLEASTVAAPSAVIVVVFVAMLVVVFAFLRGRGADEDDSSSSSSSS